ncbi:penicillin-binding transpeptidase domain-containing protein [Radiobacillus kanasensis]|uniref:penicillin-binding transpeptidase domain-containing protein n=1 Tax=Radiobacillus kanasensis TaxID=2844358 RepID=UPI001E4C6510|nr:penicillin-binding transpeptidase domain-containing protein [Radiobacillus kanasensis]UFT98567.1 penicillin-binding transpeptidase domain-containing protein [Radiobacillus kanasensis]
MKKSWAIFVLIIMMFLIIGCSKDEVTPEEKMKQFVSEWNDQKYSNMYDMLSKEAQSSFPTDQVVDRYKKIYGDLGVQNLEVKYKKPDSEKEDKDREKVTLPFSVSMDSVAGPISFDYEATWVKTENKDEEINWVLQWDPGFIFPQLKDGGEIAFETEKPHRGEIFDRNQSGLAVNEVIYEIGVVPEKFGDNPEETKKKLAELLGMDVEAIDQALNTDWVEQNLFVPLKKVPTTNKELLEKLFALEPVIKRDTTGRMYPYGKATAHLTGYIGKITAEELEEVDSSLYSANDMIGKRGLEQLFENRLKGEAGVKILIQQEGKEDVVLAEKQVKHGENIQLTIDAELQKEIFTSYQDKSGTAAAINPKTGETLALVSSPAFDPNQLAYGISQKDWDTLQNDPQSPLLNRFAATFAPGSAIKPITAAIGLKAGTLDPDEGFEINGLDWQKDESWGNYKVTRVSTSNGPVDLEDALIRSDNIYFAMQGLKMGGKTLVDGLQSFGVGEDFSFTYPIEKSTVSEDGKLDSEVLLADTSYGQGQLQMSALHLATTYTSLLNDGNIIKPILETSETKSEVWKKEVVSSDTISILKDDLRKVVTASNGTAHAADVGNFNLAGKTGTAELKKAGEESGQENGWFVVYPESEDLILSMMVEHTEELGGSHFVVDRAVEIFQAIQ